MGIAFFRGIVVKWLQHEDAADTDTITLLGNNVGTALQQISRSQSIISTYLRQGMMKHIAS